MTEQRNRGGLVVHTLLVAAATHLPAALTAQQSAVDNCNVCHSALSDERLTGPVTDFATDIHADRGLTCVSCHGVDATAEGVAGMDPAK